MSYTISERLSGSIKNGGLEKFKLYFLKVCRASVPCGHVSESPRTPLPARVKSTKSDRYRMHLIVCLGLLSPRKTDNPLILSTYETVSVGTDRLHIQARTTNPPLCTRVIVRVFQPSDPQRIAKVERMTFILFIKNVLIWFYNAA